MNITRTGPGRYTVESESVRGMAYSVQVAGERGACDCIGSEGAARKGNQCKHIRECIAEERKYPVTTEQSTAITKAEYAPVAVSPPASTLPTMDEMKVMVTIANSVYKTAGKLIPENIKTSEEAFAIMLAGHELGIPPMAAFREIYIVKGRTSPSYRVVAGLVLKGDPAARFDWKERTAERAAVRLTRGNGAFIDVEYTMEDAKRAGVAFKTRSGEDTVWAQFPADMLAKQAVVRACRLAGPDLITGIGAAVRGAPAVMAAIEEATEEGEMPELEATPEPAATVVVETVLPERVQVQKFLRDARESWDEGSHRAMLQAFNAEFPGKLNRAGDLMIGKSSDADAVTMLAWIAATYGAQEPEYERESELV